MVVSGLVTFRAYDKVKYFKGTFNDFAEKSANVTFCYYVVNRWMGLRLDLVSVVFSIAVATSVVLLKGNIEPEVAVIML